MKKVLCLPDIHIPMHDKHSLAAVEKYMAEEGPFDQVIYMGDLMDFDCISHFNAKNLRAVEGKTISKDYVVANQMLDLHREILGKNTKMVLLEGNHDYRITKVIDANPRLEGFLEVPIRLRLKERGIKWVKSWSEGEVYRIGKASFIHGLYTSKYHAEKHVQAYGTNLFYGHLHDCQAFDQVLNGDNKTIMAQSLGCLCAYRQQYLKGRPNKWQQAFSLFYFHEDGYFNHFVVRIFRHRFTSPSGKTYKG